MGAGFLMYLLVVVVLHVAKRGSRHMHDPEPFRTASLFVAENKAVALGLGALLLIMAAYNLSLIGMDMFHVAFTGQEGVTPSTTFYNDLFTGMIFTDVLTLILSIVVFRSLGSRIPQRRLCRFHCALPLFADRGLSLGSAPRSARHDLRNPHPGCLQQPHARR
jgi:hypothetical protein